MLKYCLIWSPDSEDGQGGATIRPIGRNRPRPLLAAKFIYENAIFFVFQNLGLQNFAGNYSNHNRFAKTNWQCRCLESRENEPHLTSGNCKVFGHLNERFGDLSDDENLVLFFKEVLATRDQMDENEE